MPQAKVPLNGFAAVSEDYYPALTFEAEAVGELIKVAGFKLADGLDLISVGRDLSEAVLDFVVHSARRSTDADTLKWARQTRKTALRFLVQLGGDPRTGRIPAETLSHLAAPDADDAATYPIREEMGWLQIRGTPEMDAMSDDELAAIEEGRRTKIEFRPMVDFVPPADFQAVQLAAYGAVCTARMADVLAKALGQPKRQPRQPRLAEVRFIDNLCRIYKTISGNEATLTPEGPAITFCCEVAKRTLGLLPKTPPAFDTNVATVKTSLDALKSRTVVRDRIRDVREGGHRAR